MQIFSGATGRFGVRPAERVDKTIKKEIPCRKIPGLAPELRCLAELKLAYDGKDAEVYSMTRSTNHVTRSVLISMSMTRSSLVMG